MSLINDALKRASQAQKQLPPSPVTPNSPATPHSAAAPAMQATSETRRPSSSPMIVPVMIGLIALVLLIGVGVVVWQLSGKKEGTVVETHSTASTAPKTEVSTLAPPRPTPVVPVPKPVVVAAAKVEPKPVAAEPVRTAPPVLEPKVAIAKATPPSEPVVAVAMTPTPAAVPAAPPAPAAVPTFPMIKLQGIFYRKSNPTAMLNGKTLQVGNKIDGVTISRIEPLAVTLEWNGETKVLELQ